MRRIQERKITVSTGQQFPQFPKSIIFPNSQNYPLIYLQFGTVPLPCCRTGNLHKVWSKFQIEPNNGQNKYEHYTLMKALLMKADIYKQRNKNCTYRMFLHIICWLFCKFLSSKNCWTLCLHSYSCSSIPSTLYLCILLLLLCNLSSKWCYVISSVFCSLTYLSIFYFQALRSMNTYVLEIIKFFWQQCFSSERNMYLSCTLFLNL